MFKIPDRLKKEAIIAVKNHSVFLSMLAALLIVLVSCVTPNPTDEEEEENHPYAGIYIIDSYLVNQVELKQQFIYNTLELSASGTGTIQTIDAFGKVSQSGTYTYTDVDLDLLIDIKVYKFIYDDETETLTYQGRINRKDVVMTYKFVDTFNPEKTTGGKLFNEELFGDDLLENFYNYAPTVFMEGNDTMHIWYCSNEISGNVTDFVAYRKGKLLADGTWSFTEKELVMSPTVGTWDARHVCDPSVVKGLFSYNGESYQYLMAYLGCITNDSSRNEVGVAVAKTPIGPWVKMDDINPIANYYTSPEYTNETWTWGYGQPSLVSVDKAGKILLFYTKGITSGTFQQVEYWDLSNLNDPIKLSEASITNSGVMNASGSADVINNADFAYDPQTNRLYVIKEDFPYPNSGGLNWLTATNTLLYLNLNTNDTHVGETLFKTEPLRWNVIGSIGPSDTGFFRVHNAAIMTDEYGWLMNPYQIPVVYTMTDAATDYPDWSEGGQWPALHTYRLHGYVYEL